MTWSAIGAELERRGIYNLVESALSALLGSESKTDTGGDMWTRHPHFTEREFRCQCGCGLLNTQEPLLDLCEDIRAKFGGKPFGVTSGTRCPKHNAETPGSVANSKHCTGAAVDGGIYGVHSSDVLEYAKSTGKATGYIMQSGHFHIELI